MCFLLWISPLHQIMNWVCPNNKICPSAEAVHGVHMIDIASCYIYRSLHYSWVGCGLPCAMYRYHYNHSYITQFCYSLCLDFWCIYMQFLLYQCVVLYYKAYTEWWLLMYHQWMKQICSIIYFLKTLLPLLTCHEHHNYLPTPITFSCPVTYNDVISLPHCAVKVSVCSMQ